MRRALLLSVVLLTGCGATGGKKVVNSVNDFYYYNARYEERCVNVVGPKAECAATAVALEAWKSGLKEADEASKRGGNFPLQIKHLSKLEKETKKCLPR